MQTVKTVSVSGVYVELIQVLGLMLRQGLVARIGGKRECWDIHHINTWNTGKKKPGDNASENEIADYYIGGTDKYTDHLYFASGKFLSIGFGEKVEIRVVCQLNEWHETSLSQWTLQVWLKAGGGSVARHFFYSSRGYGGDNGMTKGDIPKEMKLTPPEKIKL